MAVACKIPGHICVCCHGSGKQILCPNVPPITAEKQAAITAKINQLIAELKRT
jgi:hypothetical protein